MDRNTDIRNMNAPEVGSGKCADDTVLKHMAEYPLPSEKGSNTLEEYTTQSQPTKGAGGKAKF